MKLNCVIIAVSLAITTATRHTRGQMEDVPSTRVVLDLDSGFISNGAPGSGHVLVWMDVAAAPGAAWLRLHFGETVLAGDPHFGEEAYIRLTSTKDGARQHLDARRLREWSNASAYFNGDAVLVELYAHPGAGASRVTIPSAIAGSNDLGPTIGICGDADDRELSSEAANGRLMREVNQEYVLKGTAWMITYGNCANRFLTCGHCLAPTSGAYVVQFNVPLSTSSGVLKQPEPQDQYPVVEGSIQSNYLITGFDAGQVFTAENSETGMHAREVQQAAYVLAGEAPTPSGQTVRVSGYGVVAPPVTPTWNAVLKTHTGPLVARSGDYLGFVIDATPGNWVLP